MKTKLTIIVCLLFLMLLIGCHEQASLQPAPISPDAKLVCLFFDDGWQNQYDVALPILLEYDFKATFSVISGEIGHGQGLRKYMGVKELKELAEYGMDIACHTKTHPHLTANLTDQQLREEIINSKKHLEKMGFKVRTFVYPYYEWNDVVLNYVREAGYVCARGGWPEAEAYNLTTTDPETRYHVPSYAITNENIEEFKYILGQASRHSVVCLTYHHISDTAPPEASTPVQGFHEQMRYLKEAGFTIVLLPDLIAGKPLQTEQQ